MASKRTSPVVLSCVNLKGGVGKTAVAVNFAAFCARNELRTLLIDLDPQTNATFSCMSVEDWQKHAGEKGTVADLFGARKHTSAEGKIRTAADVLVSDVFAGVDLIPSHVELFTIDLDLGGATSRETLLRRAVKDILPNYDVVVCDCPPNLTIPTQNALALSTHYVVPVSPDFLSSLGISLLLGRVKKLSEEMETTIDHAGIVISRVGRTSLFRERTVQTLRDEFGDKVFATEIKERSAVSEAAQKQVSVFDMNDSLAIADFREFSEELLETLGIKK